MNRQSNTYTIIYSSLLVLAVGVVLALVYQLLRPAQEENISNDTKRQILAAALINVKNNESVAEVYQKHIISSYLVGYDGKRKESDIDPFDVNIATQVKQPGQERKLPVFECLTDDGLKYILPVYGAGLWGPIWGYIAFNTDGDTIYGAYFAHQGETPGLGAEIEKPGFRNQFHDKAVFSDSGEFKAIAVVKSGQEPSEQSWVHAVSGGTITSQGVQKMLFNSLQPYSAFLKSLSKAGN